MCHKSGLQNGEIWKYQIGVAVWKAKTDLSEILMVQRRSASHVHMFCAVLCCAVLS